MGRYGIVSGCFQYFILHPRAIVTDFLNMWCGVMQNFRYRDCDPQRPKIYIYVCICICIHIYIYMHIVCRLHIKMAHHPSCSCLSCFLAATVCVCLFLDGYLDILACLGLVACSSFHVAIATIGKLGSGGSTRTSGSHRHLHIHAKERCGACSLSPVSGPDAASLIGSGQELNVEWSTTLA